MNRTLSMILGIVAVLAAGVVFASYKHHLQVDVARAQARDKEAPVETISGTVDDLLATHRSLTCTFSSSLPDNTVSFDGVVYVANGQVRADVRGTVEGVTGVVRTSHMLRTQNRYYLWNDTDSQAGYLIRQADAVANMKNTDLPQLLPTGRTDYFCHTASHPAGSFTVPSDVVFVDVTEALGGRGVDLPTVRGAFTTSECDKCATFGTEVARTRCQSVLHCK